MNNIIEDILKGLYDLCPKGKQEIDFFKAREYLLSSLNKVIEERDKEILEEYRKSISSIKGSVVCAEKTIAKFIKNNNNK